MFVARGLTKVFGSTAVPVLDHVDVAFSPGEIHALLGANGAGKSTLCKIIAGLHSATAGEMTWQDEPFCPRSKQDAERRGVQIVQQELNLIANLDVAHNLFLGRLPHHWGSIRRRVLYADARDLLDAFGLVEVDEHSLVSAYGVGQQQMLEIAANLARSCSLLILDEPTAALSVREAELLFGKLRAARDQGTAIVYVSHRLDEVLALADRATILRDGRRVGTFPIRGLTSARLVEWMTHGNAEVPAVGEKATVGEVSTPQRGDRARLPTAAPARLRSDRRGPRTPCLQVRGLSAGSKVASSKVRDVDFTVHAGEIFGIAGLVGSGRTELLRRLFGADVSGDGELAVGNGPWRPLFRSPAEAVEQGVVMISEDRKADGLLLGLSIRDNIVVSQLADRRKRPASPVLRDRWGRFHPSQATRVAEMFRESLEIRCRDCEQVVATLSGGNQQKVVVAKWLLRGASVFLLDEPTRGIDANSRELIYRVLRELGDQGKGMVVVSSDLEELMRLSDRIGVLSNGRWITEFSGPVFSAEEITAAMFAGYAGATSPQQPLGAT